MAARRCVLHGSFPIDFKFQACPVCGERTDYISNAEPDEHWESNIVRHQERIVRGETEIPEIPVLEGVKAFIENDQYYLSSHEIIQAGVQRRLQPGDLVQIGKQVFETQTYSYAKRRYYVRPFSTTLSDEDLSSLAGP